MDPYRGGEDRVEAEAPRDRGIVGDVIEQFADPLAFYRELIQNAIDAGSPAIDVHVAASGDTVRVTVRDQGEGMTRDILENQLLVLFRSTKEHDDTKIGKFGIGFASVLAPRPRVVVVTTVRDGRRLALHLNPDLGYQVFDGGPAERAGTSVELELAMAPDEVEAFARRSLDAIVRWCRHASVPIRFTAPGFDGVRVDRPLALDGAIVSVRGQTDDGQTIAVVGVLPGAQPYAGFFDHGLTLYESPDAGLGRVAFKVQDRRLGHTISRDNVLRDGAYDRALGFVRALVERDLPRVTAAAVREAAESGDRGAYRTLVTALAEANALPARDAWAVPLIEPLGERRSVVVGELNRRCLGARRRSVVTQAVTSSGEPVIDVCDGDTFNLPFLLHAHGDRTLTYVEHELTLVEPVREPTPSDQLLLQRLERILDHAHRAPSAIRLAELEGALVAAISITGSTDGPTLVAHDTAQRSPFGRLRRPALLLNTRAAPVIAARKLAEDDPVNAASLLARAILLRYGLLDATRSLAILEITLAGVA